MDVGDIGFALASCFTLFILMLIGIADHKFLIIPDQFTMALAICGIGFLPYHLKQAAIAKAIDGNASYIATHGFMSPILGALAAAAIFLTIAFLAKLIFKQESLGFGDVKLMLSVGIIIGIYKIVAFIVAVAFLSAIESAFKLITKKAKASDHQALGDIIAIVCAFYVLVLY